MRIVPPPAGVTLPKDAVHLEIVMPRPDLEEMPAVPPPPPPQARAPGSKSAPPPPAPKPAPTVKVKKIPRKPLVLHILAVPDQGGTWLGVGLDAKLLAQKAAASLSSAPDATSLAKLPGTEALREAKANGAWFATLRGLLVYTALGHGSHTPYATLASLNAKGATPILLTFLSQGPSASAPAGSAVATFKLPRAAIEDIVKIAMSR